MITLFPSQRGFKATACFECLFHVLGFCLCSVTQHHEIIGVADVEEIAFSLFSSPAPLGFGEFQVLGFHILVHCIEVYVGQEGAHYTPYKVANLVLEYSTSIARTQLRPGYGDGFLGAPLHVVPSRHGPTSQEQGDRRGTSSQHTAPDSG